MYILINEKLLLTLNRGVTRYHLFGEDPFGVSLEAGSWVMGTLQKSRHGVTRT